MTKQKDKAKKNQTFQFNLMNTKSKEELKSLEERDESTLYSLILLFLGAIVYFLLTLLQFSLIETKIKNTKNTIASVEQNINGYDSVRNLNGELFIKANLLSPVLAQDIKVNNFLEVTTSIVGSSQVLSYSREESGLFVINITVEGYAKILDIITTSQTNESVENLRIRNITFDTTRFNNYIVTLEFALKA